VIADDDIRDTLHRHAADATVSADAWQRVEARIASGESGGHGTGPGSPGGPGRWTVTMLAAAAVLVVVAASVALLSFDEDQKVRTAPVDGGATTTPTSSPERSVTTPSTGSSTTTSEPSGSPTSVSTDTTMASPGSSTTTEPPRAPVKLTDQSKLTMTGIGPVEVGMTIEEASEASGLTVQFEPNSFISGVPGQGCGFASAVGGPDGVDFMVVDDRIVRVDVMRGAVTTVSGIGIGSSEQKIQATYEGVVVEQHEYWPDGQYLIYRAPSEPAHMLLFETDGGVVSNFRSGFEIDVRAPEGCA
jgi:hypothetical protein